MLITEHQKKYTAADYDMLEEGAPFQLINYDLVMSPLPLPIHQIILGRIFKQLSDFIDENNNNGIVLFAPIDVYFDEGNIFQTDLIYISEEKKSIIQKRIEGTPDMVLEILSPSNAYYDLRQKKDTYEKYGVKEYMIIDPIAQNAEVYILQDNVFQLYQKAEIKKMLNSVVLPGFKLDLHKVFR